MKHAWVINGESAAFGLTAETTQDGLSKREYFAGLAMQGLMVNNLSRGKELNAELSVKQADALLKELEK